MTDTRPTSLPFSRKELTAEISASCKEGRRLVLVGRPGSGRFSAIKAALSGWDLVAWDLSCISREEQLDQLPFVENNFQSALQKLDQSRKRAALVLRNLDGPAGARDENAVMGRLRSEVQGLHKLRVLYTASDAAFVGRHFGSSTGAFFKQAVMIEVPDLDDTEIGQWAHKHFAWVLDSAPLSALVEGAGRRAGDVAIVLSTLQNHRDPQQSSLIGLDEILLAIRTIVEARHSCYAEMCARQLTSVQRSVLWAIAKGMPAKATKQMIEATGLGKGSLGSTLWGLRASGWLHSDQNGQVSFSDPFLRLYIQSV